MATSTAKQFEQVVKQLIDERQEHLDAVADIDAALERAGLNIKGQTGRAGKATRGAASRNGRKAAGQATSTATASGRKKSTGKGKRPGRKRQTAEQWVLGRLKDSKPQSTGDINTAWKQSGRPGAANNALTKLVKEGKLQRTNIEGARGSQYSLA